MSERLEKNSAQGIRTNESDLDVAPEYDHQWVTHPAVPLQYKAGSSSGQELQQEKEEHSGTAEEKYVMASAIASSFSGGDDESKNEGNPLQGKFTSGGAGNQSVSQYKYQISGSYPAVPIQRMGGPEEEEMLQGKMSDPIQRTEGPEEEEMLQGKMSDPVQRMGVPEEEEMLQGKMNGAIQRMGVPEEEEPMQGKMSGVVQRESAPEEEEPLQGKMHGVVQRESAPEEEEPMQGKMSGVVQRESAPEEEEPMQGKMNGVVQRESAPEEEEPMQGKMSGVVQRESAPEEEEPMQGKMLRPIQKKSNRTQTIQRQSATAAKLPDLVQSKMEGAMGADFSGVNIHTESQNATNVGALAYAQGNDVHFAPGQYDPQSSSGQELIGHELAHVVQQREGRVQPTTQTKGIPVNDDKGLEAEADDMGRKAAQMKVKGTIGEPKLQTGEYFHRGQQEGNVISRKFDSNLEMIAGVSQQNSIPLVSNFSKLGNNFAIQRKIGDGNDLKSARFATEITLEGVFDGESTLQKGSSGVAVKKIQQAIIDGGFALTNFGIDGKFGKETEASVKNFQNAIGFKGASSNGIVDAATMKALDKRFQNEGAKGVQTLPSGVAVKDLVKDVVDGGNVVAKFNTSKGFTGLNAKEQNKFTSYVSGYDPYISKPARIDFESSLTAGTFDLNKAESFRKYMKDQPGRLQLISVGPNFRKDKRNGYKVTGPTDVKNHGFRSGVADAANYTVEIAKQKVPVNLPKNPIVGNSYQTIDEVAKGLAVLSATSLSVVQTVNVEPNLNPDDAHWKKVYPGFTQSYMTAGATGVISIYPGQQTQNVLDSSIMHETGHTLSNQRFGQGKGPGWDNWKRAANQDVIYPSTYATNAQEEDFAETTALHTQIKGTVYEDTVKAIIPNRMAIMDTVVSQGED